MFGMGPMELVIVLAMLGGMPAVAPLSLPPLPPDPIIMRAAPEECLFYLGLAGSAKPDPNSPNQTEQLLAEPEVSEFITKLETELLDLWQQSASTPEEKTVADELPVILRTVLTRPAALYVERVAVMPGNVDVRAALVVNAGNQAAALRESLEKIEALIVAESRLQGQVETVTIGNVKLSQLPVPPGAPAVHWGFKDEYLLITIGDQTVRDLVARLNPQSKVASWLNELHRQLPVERPAMTAHFNIAGALQAARPMMSNPRQQRVLQALGISNLHSFSSVMGLEGEGMTTRSLLAIDGVPQGLFALSKAEPLTIAHLKPIPHDATVAFVTRLDPAEVYRQVLAGIAKVDADASEEFKEQVAGLEQQLDIRLQADLLEPLGDVWTFYNSPSGAIPGAGLTAMITVRDREKLEATYQKLLEQARPALEDKGIVIRESEYQGEQIYYAQSTKTPIPFSPAWTLTKDRLIIALTPQMLKSVLARPPNADSLADIPRVAQLFQGEPGPISVSYQDTKASLQVLYTYLQLFLPTISGELAKQGIDLDLAALPPVEVVTRHALPTVSATRRTDEGVLMERHQSIPGASFDATSSGPMMVALLLPAIQAAREAARRQTSMNNLRQIAIAMLNHHDRAKRFPADVYSKDKKPLLSWRVRILPYLDEEALYREFRLDEPWDSEHNRKLIAKMPAVYRNPNASAELIAAGKTMYLRPTGEAAMFNNGPEGPRMADIKDGASMTIMAVEAPPESAVVWTRPDDLEIDPKNILAQLQGLRSEGFLAVMVDGSAKLVSYSVDPQVLRALFTPAGREIEEDPESPE